MGRDGLAVDRRDEASTLLITEHSMADDPQTPVDDTGTEAPETTPEAPRSAEPGAGPDAELAALRAQLEEVTAEAQTNWEKLLRAQADLDNLRKRSARDLENAHRYALDKFAGDLLGVRDSLELGLQAARETTDVGKIREGTELTLKMLAQLMEKYEIREIDPQGAKFDPDLHQAMMTQESSEAAPNTVLSVMQKGYSLKDRLLRPALVVVAKAP
jgi:molecular chaperone GrpE